MDAHLRRIAGLPKAVADLVRAGEPADAAQLADDEENDLEQGA